MAAAVRPRQFRVFAERIFSCRFQNPQAVVFAVCSVIKPANLLNLLSRMTLPTEAVDKYVDIAQKSALNAGKHRLRTPVPKYCAVYFY